MEVFISILLAASLCLLFIGIFNPKISLFWIKKQSKRTRKMSFFIYLFLLLFMWALLIILPRNNYNTSVKKDGIKKDLLYEKDIDLNTGDTIYKASMFAEGPFLFHYSKGRIAPTAILTFNKLKENIEVSLFITLGEFIEGDTVDVYFKGVKPDVKYTYKLKSNNEAILNIPNPEAFMKKVNIELVMHLHVPIQKQEGYKVPFSYIHDEGKVTFDKSNFNN